GAVTTRAPASRARSAVRSVLPLSTTITSPGTRVARHSRTTPAIGSSSFSAGMTTDRSEEHTSELQSLTNLVCRLLLEKKKPASAATRAPPPSPSRAGTAARTSPGTPSRPRPARTAPHPLRPCRAAARCPQRVSGSAGRPPGRVLDSRPQRRSSVRQTEGRGSRIFQLLRTYHQSRENIRLLMEMSGMTDYEKIGFIDAWQPEMADYF